MLTDPADGTVLRGSNYQVQDIDVSFCKLFSHFVCGKEDVVRVQQVGHPLKLFENLKDFVLFLSLINSDLVQISTARAVVYEKQP